MRKMTYDQVAEELTNALKQIDINYKLEFDSGSVQLVPGDFAYSEFTIELPEIMLPCGITISSIFAIYPATTYTAYIPPDNNLYGLDLISNADIWDIPDDLQVYQNEDDMDDPDALTYDEDDLIDELKFGILDVFLRYPDDGNGIQLFYSKEDVMPFDMLAKVWLKEADLNQLNISEHKRMIKYGSDDIKAEYTERLASLEVIPSCLDFSILRWCNEYFCGGVLDLSHFKYE